MNNSATNGLGAFYWEPAWIPVVPGWKNWQADANAAEKYGSGWIASPAQGYLPDGDLFFHGKPTWGGSSWDNNTLFDAQGHPLQSLKFYQKAIGNKRGLQLTRIKYVDQQGKLIRPMQYRRLKLGQKVKISPLKVNRYTALSKTRKVIGKTAGLVTIRFKYRDKPHAKIKQRVAVKQAMKGISRRKYRLYRNFYWKKAATQTYGQTFMVRYFYTTQSGSKYASLYTVRGKKWVGYLNVKGLKRTSLVGSAHRYGHRVKITSRKYVLYRNFSWKKQSRKIYQRRFFAKYYYRHANGAQYYSLYTLTGNKWVGYVNTRAAVNVR
ncbi:MAG: glycosyl hydrolase 53 family protein [Lactobacillus sp.]